MKFNKEQKEGIARSFDALAVSSVIAVVLGVTGHSVLSGIELILLTSAALVLPAWSYLIRK